MRFRYTEVRNKQDPSRPFPRPYLIVRLHHEERHKDVIALVDSGADLCLFHSDIGRMLGIDIEAAPQLAFQGVSGARELAYLFRINLEVRGLNTISLDVGFTNSMAVGTGLLGQRGFFEQFHVSFQLKEKFFEIFSAAK
ncbi:MAG TPA: hypothetical protein VHE60_00040 [Pyrinomonadaceae bacterium]|nr:hypothetical protein [Pyrinomonadaceae bacterium]